MINMGGIGSMMDKIPGMANVPQHMRDQANNNKAIPQQIAIINSMTQQERRSPITVLNGSRKRRIARGSGTTIQDINRLLKQFKQIQKAMKKFKKGNMANMMRGMQGNFRGGMPF